MIQRIRSRIGTCLALLLFGSISTGIALEPGAPNRAALAAEDWTAIEHCLGIIRSCQLEDGMIRMKSDGAPVWAVPYCANFAALALLAAHEIHPNDSDLRRVERWLIWYANHQESDGTICDREGTLSAYGSKGKRDSTDSYAATFLMVAHRYQRASSGGLNPAIDRAARQALAAISAVVQPDGLTIAKPDYPAKYLMDNLEVYGGLQEGARFFEATGSGPEAKTARLLASGVARGLQKFWSEKDRCFGSALSSTDKISVGLAKSYPDGLAQLFALAHLAPERTALWQEVRKRFSPEDEGMPTERWLMAAVRCAGVDEKEKLRQATRRVMQGFTAKSVYVDRPALAILALIDGPARFADVERAKLD